MCSKALQGCTNGREGKANQCLREIVGHVEHLWGWEERNMCASKLCTTVLDGHRRAGGEKRV